jgi:hypothetical protein
LAAGGRLAYPEGMCRNIRPLHNFEPPATQEEARDAALQYVRKISGYTKPSQANEEAFLRAVDTITAATSRLLDELVTHAPPKDREVEAAKARARSAARYAA